MVIHDIATSCRELLSSTTLPDDLPTTLKQLLQVCVYVNMKVNIILHRHERLLLISTQACAIHTYCYLCFIVDCVVCKYSFSKWVWLH